MLLPNIGEEQLLEHYHPDQRQAEGTFRAGPSLTKTTTNDFLARHQPRTPRRRPLAGALSLATGSGPDRHNCARADTAALGGGSEFRTADLQRGALRKCDHAFYPDAADGR